MDTSDGSRVLQALSMTGNAAAPNLDYFLNIVTLWYGMAALLRLHIAARLSLKVLRGLQR